MKSFVYLIFALLLFTFITGQTPVSSTSSSSHELTELINKYLALIVSVLAIISTVLGYIYQRRNFKLELEKFKKKFVSAGELYCSWIEEADAQPKMVTAQSTFTSPYICGPPIIHREDFYGRKTLSKMILNAAAGGPQMQSIAITGGPLSGKTSLINYIKHPHTLKEHNFENIIPVYLNLEAGIINPAVFYARLLHETVKAIRKYGIVGKQIPFLTKDIVYHVAENFFETASKKFERFKFLLIIDKFEKLSVPAFTSEFFGNLRSLSTNRPIAWITTAFKPLSKIFYEKFGEISSPFINIFLQNYFIPPLSNENAHKLAKEPAIKNGLPFSSDELVFIIHLDRLMPFEIQVVSDTLYKAKIENPNDSLICKKIARREYAKIMGNHYQRYWRTLEPDEQSLLKSIANGNQDRITDSKITDLVNYGYIIEKEDSYHIAGAVFKDWIRKSKIN